jgi:type II secretory pathway pseudopilin PulG
MISFLKKFHTKKIKARKGFLLVEMMVSLTIFAFVSVATTAALLSIIDANAKAQSLRSVMDNLTVAVENMSRLMRIGTHYGCIVGVTGQEGSLTFDERFEPADCIEGAVGVSFLPQDGDPTDPSERVNFYYKTDPAEGTGSIYRYQNGVETQYTAPEVDITNLNFYVLAIDEDNAAADGQSRILISINGLAGSITRNQSSFVIQTSVSQRKPDCVDIDSCNP